MEDEGAEGEHEEGGDDEEGEGHVEEVGDEGMSDEEGGDEGSTQRFLLKTPAAFSTRQPSEVSVSLM